MDNLSDNKNPTNFTEFKIDICDLELEYCGELSLDALKDTTKIGSDLFPLPGGEGTEYSQLEKFPTFWGSFCRVGNQIYLNNDQSIRIENRPEEEVIKSLNTFRNKPVTIDHPGLVFPENAIKDRLMRGLTHEDVDYHRGIGRIRITLVDKEAIEAINKDYRQLSAAYLAKVFPVKGDWFGEPYTHQQRDIIGNAIGLVKRGRAGNFARIHTFDSAEKIKLDEQEYPVSIQLQVYRNQQNQETQEQEKPKEDIIMSNSPTSPVNQSTENKTTITIDSIPYQISESAALAVNGRFTKDSAQISNLETEIKQLKESHAVEKTQLNQELQTAQQKLEELQGKLDTALDPAKKQQEIDERVLLQINGVKVLGDNFKFSGLSNRQIQEEILKKLQPNLVFNGRSDDAIALACDIAIQNYKPAQDQAPQTQQTQPQNTSQNNQGVVQARQAVNDSHLAPRANFMAVGFHEDEDEELYQRQVEQLYKNASMPLSSSARRNN